MKKHHIDESRVAVQAANGQMMGSLSSRTPSPQPTVSMAGRTGRPPTLPALSISHPELAAELVDQSLADSLTAGSSKKVQWRCDEGHRWNGSVGNRVNGRGCAVCGNRSVLAGFNDLATTHPELAAELVDQSLATRLVAGTPKKVWWECRQGHRWESGVRVRTKYSTGCPTCSNKSVLAGFNDLATTHPELAAELVDQSLATRLVAGSNKKVGWRCRRGHGWEAVVASRVNGRGCPTCGNRTVLVGFNDLATTHPELAAELVDESLALSHTAGSGKRAQWRCDAGHEWSATFVDRANGEKGCSSCTDYGYDPTKPASIYLLVDDIQMAATVAQFGISNDVSRRLREHQRSGFTSPPVLIVEGAGDDVAALEKRFKRERKRRAILNCTEEGLLFDGSTEAFILEGSRAAEFYDWIRVEMQSFGDRAA